RRQPLTVLGGHGAAVDALEGAAPLPVVQVAPGRRFRHADLAGQVGEGDEPPALDQFQDLLAAIFDEHGGKARCLGDRCGIVCKLGGEVSREIFQKLSESLMSPADWQLPPGVSRGLWDYLHDAGLARGYDASLAGSPLLGADLRFAEEQFPSPGRLIDLGCGTGRLAVAFARRGFRVVAV